MPSDSRTTRFGNIVTLDGNQPDQVLSLLWGPLEDQVDADWETWVFSWRIRDVTGLTIANPAVAFITLGAGGAVVQAVINIAPSGSIQLPSTVAKIEVGWDPLLRADMRANPGFFLDSCTVEGIMRKGATSQMGHRVINVQADGVGLLPPVVDIPAMARRVNVWPGANAVPFDPATLYGFDMSPGGTTADIYQFTGPEADAARANGESFIVPGMAIEMAVRTVPAAGTYGGFFDFQIGF